MNAISENVKKTCAFRHILNVERLSSLFGIKHSGFHNNVQRKYDLLFVDGSFDRKREAIVMKCYMTFRLIALLPIQKPVSLPLDLSELKSS